MSDELADTLREILEELKLIRRAVVPEPKKVKTHKSNFREGWRINHDPNKEYQKPEKLAWQIREISEKLGYSNAGCNALFRLVKIPTAERSKYDYLKNWEPKHLYEWHAYHFAKWCIKENVDFKTIRTIGESHSLKLRKLMRDIVEYYDNGGE